jgi:hypothetical protein
MIKNRKPTVLVEISTKDTGERKEMFSYTARHVITTRTDGPLGDTTASMKLTVGCSWSLAIPGKSSF